MTSKLFLNRYLVSRDGTITTLAGKVLKPYDNNSMNVAFYKRIKLVSLDGKRRGHYVHRIVASLFIGSINGIDGMDVDHIDGNTQNNDVSNLRLVRHGDNMRLMMDRTGRSERPIIIYGKNFKRVRYV